MRGAQASPSDHSMCSSAQCYRSRRPLIATTCHTGQAGAAEKSDGTICPLPFRK